MSQFPNQSIWHSGSGLIANPALTKDISVDVAIVGGGIAGLTAGYILSAAGKSVAILEMHNTGFGETGLSTAHLTQILDIRYRKLIDDFGLDAAKAVMEAKAAAIDFVKVLLNEAQPISSFTSQSAYLYSEKFKNIEALKIEQDAMQLVGINAQWREVLPLPFASFGGIECNGQASINPMQLVTVLTQAIRRQGGKIFENTMVKEIEAGDVVQVLTNGAKVSARNVIVTSHTPVATGPLIHLMQTPYRSYVIAFETYNNMEVRGLFYDNIDPYHYIRGYKQSGNHNLVILGGEDHKTGHEMDADSCFERLEEFAAERFQLKQITNRWSGQIIETLDGLPYIGRNALSDNLYIASGFSGNGITYGTIAGRIISDTILGRVHPCAELLSPHRVRTVGSVVNFLSGNADVSWQFVKDWVGPGEMSDFMSINPGEGKIVRFGMQKAAVYRDESGKISCLSAVCPHMGGHVHFNSAERSWDCSCHGSRFDVEGSVLNGPANSGLRKLDLAQVASEGETAPIKLGSLEEMAVASRQQAVIQP